MDVDGGELSDAAGDLVAIGVDDWIRARRSGKRDGEGDESEAGHNCGTAPDVEPPWPAGWPRRRWRRGRGRCESASDAGPEDCAEGEGEE